MSTNAPYFSQFSNGTNAQFAPEDDDYDLSASVASHTGSLYVDPEAHPNSFEENHNLVRLFEAATSAAGQAAQAMNHDITNAGIAAPGKGKRKRASSPSGDDAVRAIPSSRKRAKIDIPTDPQLQAQGESAREAPDDNSPLASSESPLVDARAAGVHSAAALFRRSSERTTKKYTRPPMSKLFISLQLTPEDFLQLQARAKTYMLDPGHPERQNCVGNRGKGDTDIVKLRLFNCVRDFLADGAGDQFFGEDVEKPGETDAIEAARALGQEQPISGKKLVWPRDGNQIISIVTPLLRRMVTNERQRMYAIETRKGGRKKEASVEANVEANVEAASITNPEPAVDSIEGLQPMQPAMSPAMPQMSTASGAGSVEMSRISGHILPVAPEYDLHRIRILVAKDNIRLKTDKTINGNLDNYDFDAILAEVCFLVRSVQIEYPQLRSNNAADELSDQFRGMRPEALQSLAVAATADLGSVRLDSVTSPTAANMGPDDASSRGNLPQLPAVEDTARNTGGPDDASTRGIAPTSPKQLPIPEPEVPSAIRRPSITLGPDPGLPRVVLKTVTANGLVEIPDNEKWQDVKKEVGYAAWSGGVLNLLVEWQ